MVSETCCRRGRKTCPARRRCRDGVGDGYRKKDRSLEDLAPLAAHRPVSWRNEEHQFRRRRAHRHASRGDIKELQESLRDAGVDHLEEVEVSTRGTKCLGGVVNAGVE